MPIRVSERTGLGGAAKHVADRVRSIVRLEIQLALTEVKRKLLSLGVGIGLLVVGGLLMLFVLAFALAAAAAAIATALDVWLALLVLAGGLFLLAGVLAAVGVSLLKKGSPPVPEQAIEEARMTAEALRDGHQ
jgi:hypothetical protein